MKCSGFGAGPDDAPPVMLQIASDSDTSDEYPFPPTGEDKHL